MRSRPSSRRLARATVPVPIRFFRKLRRVRMHHPSQQSKRQKQGSIPSSLVFCLLPFAFSLLVLFPTQDLAMGFTHGDFLVDYFNLPAERLVVDPVLNRVRKLYARGGSFFSL